MSSRNAILTALRRNAPPALPLPNVPAGIAYADPETQFAETKVHSRRGRAGALEDPGRGRFRLWAPRARVGRR